MSRSEHNQGLQAHIKLLYDNRALIEDILYGHGGEMTVPFDDDTLSGKVDALRRSEIIQVRTERGGQVLSLSPGTREFCRIVEGRNRLEAISVDVPDALQRLDTELGRWQTENDQGRHSLADQQRTRIVQIIRDVEHKFSFQIDHIHGQIEAGTGFDDQPKNQIKAFEYYIERLVILIGGAELFTARLGERRYEHFGFLLPVISQVSARFQQHGVIMDRLMSRLRDYIARLVRRQQSTQRSVLFAQWLRQQTPPLSFPTARAAAHRLPVTHRAPPLTVAAVPDLTDQTVADLGRGFAEDVIRRQRRNQRAREEEKSARPASGAVTDTEALQSQAQVAHREEQRHHWNVKPWLNDFLRTVRDQQAAGACSAIDYWRDASRNTGDAPCPTPRAWLNELVMLHLSDRRIGQAPAHEVIDIEYILGDDRSSPVLLDCHVSMKDAGRDPRGTMNPESR